MQKREQLELALKKNREIAMIDDCLQIDLSSLLTKINKSVKANEKKSSNYNGLFIFTL